jgi:hypothetical protein
MTGFILGKHFDAGVRQDMMHGGCNLQARCRCRGVILDHVGNDSVNLDPAPANDVCVRMKGGVHRKEARELVGIQSVKCVRVTREEVLDRGAIEQFPNGCGIVGCGNPNAEEAGNAGYPARQATFRS